jgi:hypothetical protein
MQPIKIICIDGIFPIIGINANTKQDIMIKNNNLKNDHGNIEIMISGNLQKASSPKPNIIGDKDNIITTTAPDRVNGKIKNDKQPIFPSVLLNLLINIPDTTKGTMLIPKNSKQATYTSQ